MLSVTASIFICLLVSALYHLIPQTNWRSRFWLVAAVSFAVVLAYYPVAAVLAIACAVFSWTVTLLAARSHTVGKYGPLLILPVLAVFSVEDFYVQKDPYSTTLVQFGMSFYVLRLYLAMRTQISRKQKGELVEFLVTALFFPIFAAGPICAQEAFRGSADTNRSLSAQYLSGLYRIGIGITFLYLFSYVVDWGISQTYQGPEGAGTPWAEIPMYTAYGLMFLGFLKLFVEFAGYTEVAIGLGMFFGFRIPENFKHPYLATNIQNFWQRWHLSLSRFITKQIYMPLMLWWRKPRVAILAAFVLVGLWHHVNLQYLTWGLGHGLALFAYMTASKSKRYQDLVSYVPRYLHIALAWLLTMSWVSFLSVFANEPSLQQALAFAQALTPLTE